LYAELGVKPLAEGEVRDAQPQYAHLPIPRADIPEGVILSRDGQSYLHETEIDTDEFLDKRGDLITAPAIALPLYEGRMVGIADPSAKGWVSGKGRGSVWNDIPFTNKIVMPQYLIAQSVRNRSNARTVDTLVTHKRIGSATNERSSVACVLNELPGGDTAAVFWTATVASDLRLACLLSSMVFDKIMRLRLGGLHLDYHVYEQNPLPYPTAANQLDAIELRQSQPWVRSAPIWAAVMTKDQIDSRPWRKNWALTPHERLRLRCISECLVAAAYKLSVIEFNQIIEDCHHPIEIVTSKAHSKKFDPKGFWRIDKELPPEHRGTVLSFVAYSDLISRVIDGDFENAISGFLNQNDGEGWQIPEEIDLGEYGLGDGSGGRVEVRSRFGPRYFGWQESQGVEESWRECHLHARNLLGPSGYASLLADLQSPPSNDPASQSPHPDGISAGPSGPTASGSAASLSGQSAKSSSRLAESSTPSGSPSSSCTSPTGVSNASPLGDSPPFDPDTFTLSNDPVPKKRKKR
jgi:hypothetical protein